MVRGASGAFARVNRVIPEWRKLFPGEYPLDCLPCPCYNDSDKIHGESELMSIHTDLPRADDERIRPQAGLCGAVTCA